MAFQSRPKFRLGTRPSYYHFRQSLVIGWPLEEGAPVDETVPWSGCRLHEGCSCEPSAANIASSWEMSALALKMGSGWDTTPTRKSRKSHKQIID